MSEQKKSPTSPTKSDGSPLNNIQVIKTNDTDNTMVEVKVAGESGADVTVFGGDGSKTENRAGDTNNAAEEKTAVHQTGSSINNAEEKTAVHQTGSSMDNAEEKTAVHQTGSSMDNAEEKTAVHQTGSSMDNADKNNENEDNKSETNESVSKTEHNENNSDNKYDKKEGSDNDVDKPLEPMTQEEIDKIVSKHAKMDKKELEKYLAFFWSVDTFGFGVFTIHQLTYRLHEMGLRISSLDIAKMFTDIDANNDCLISLEEYLEEMSKDKRKKKTTEEWQAEFDRCDRNHDGFICEEDIKTILEERNVDYNIVNIFKFLYYNGAGEDMKLNVHEFRRALQRW